MRTEYLVTYNKKEAALEGAKKNGYKGNGSLWDFTRMELHDVDLAFPTQAQAETYAKSVLPLDTFGCVLITKRELEEDRNGIWFVANEDAPTEVTA